MIIPEILEWGEGGHRLDSGAETPTAPAQTQRINQILFEEKPTARQP